MQTDAPAPPAPARLTSCPDCGGQVSTQAPVCVHCGLPLARHPRPVAGIVTALVLGVLSIVLAVVFVVDRYTPADLRVLQWSLKGLHVLACGVLLAGAALSLGGNPAGNRTVRAVSRAMVGVLLAAAVVLWILLAGLGPPDGGSEPNWVPLVLFLAAIGTAPWLLYLYLFRRSRYP